METQRSKVVGWTVYSAFIWSILFAVMFTGTGVIEPTASSSDSKIQITQIN